MGDGRTILVVDDTPFDWSSVTAELLAEDAHLRVERVHCERELTAALEACRFDLVVAEQRLSWGSAFEVLRRVKGRVPEALVFLCTVSPCEELAAQALQAGFEECLVKAGTRLLGARLALTLMRERLRRVGELSDCRKGFLDVVGLAPIPLMVVERSALITFVNDRFVTTFGYRPEELPDLDEWWRRSCPDPGRRAQMVALWQRMHVAQEEGGLGTKPQRCHLVCKNGTVHTVELWRTEVGESELLMLNDVTQLTRADEKVLQLAAIVESSDDAIIGKTVDGIITSWNRGAERIYGYHRDEVLGKSIMLIVPPERQEELRRILQRVRRGEHVEHLETERVKKDGTVIQMSLTISPIIDEEGQVVSASAIGSDITYRKNLESQLRHSQKMEALGTLSGGIAHDFNNILTAIIGHAALLAMKVEASDPALMHVQQIQEAAGRAANLTKSLLAFGRKKAIETKAVDLNAVIAKVEKLLVQLMREDIDFRCDTAREELTVLADAGQVEQVLVNLATNARDALPQGGAIRISTVAAELDREFVRTHGYGTPGRYACVIFSDNGMGMDEGTRQRIFEPFFTTKEVGKGTGLGLSIVYGIIKQHGGYVNCYSEPGKGTSFRIYLPLTSDPAEEEAALPEIPPPRGSETILLVEDDAATRNMNRQLLESFGYRIIEAVDGEDAVARFKEHREEVALVFIDAIMPKKGGRDAYREISSVNPGVKVLFTSGYAADIYEKGELSGPNFISKPIMPTFLLRKVREIIEG